MANQSVSPGAQQIPAAYANERDYAPGWVNEKKIKTALTPFFGLPFGEITRNNIFKWRLASNLFSRYVIRKQTSY